MNELARNIVDVDESELHEHRSYDFRYGDWVIWKKRDGRIEGGMYVRKHPNGESAIVRQSALVHCFPRIETLSLDPHMKFVSEQSQTIEELVRQSGDLPFIDNIK